MICRVVLYSIFDEIINIFDYIWIIGLFDFGVLLIMILIWGNVCLCCEIVMLDILLLFIFMFDMGDESLKFVLFGIMMGKVVCVIVWVSEVILFSFILLVKLLLLVVFGLL